MVEVNKAGKIQQKPFDWATIFQSILRAGEVPPLPTNIPPGIPIPSGEPPSIWSGPGQQPSLGTIFRAMREKAPGAGLPMPRMGWEPGPAEATSAPVNPVGWRPSARLPAVQPPSLERPPTSPAQKAVLDQLAYVAAASAPTRGAMPEPILTSGRPEADPGVGTGMGTPTPRDGPAGAMLQNLFNAARLSNQGKFPWQGADTTLFPPDPNASAFSNFIRSAVSGAANVPFTVNAAARNLGNPVEMMRQAVSPTTPPPATATPEPTPSVGLPGIALPRAPGGPFGGAPGGIGGVFGGIQGGGRGLSIPIPGGPTPMGERTPGFQRYLERYEGTGQNPNSTAFGPGQFIDSTFLSFLKDRYPQIYQQFTTTGDPGGLKQLKKELGNEAIDWYKAKNTEYLAGKNLPVNDQTIALSHRLGPGAAEAVLRADPNTPLQEIYSKLVGAREAARVFAANPDMSGKTAGQFLDVIRKATDTSVTPRPPELGKPPEQVPGAPADYSIAREFMDKAKPKPLDQAQLDSMLASGVLSKAALGAAGVDATRPGSFASALAAAGGGAAGGAQEGQRFSFNAQQQKEAEERAHYTTRGQQELGIAGQQQDYGKYASDIAFKNAQNAYNVATENLDRQYKWQVGERAAVMPKVSFEGGNISVQYFDPVSQSVKINQLPKSMMDRAEDISKMTAALKNIPPTHPEAQAITAYMITQMNAGDPSGHSAAVMMRHQAIKHALATGGLSAFGLKPAELKALQDQVEKETSGLAAKPEERYAAQQDKMAGLLHNRLNQNSAGWAPILDTLARTGNTYALLEWQRMMQGQGR